MVRSSLLTARQNRLTERYSDDTSVAILHRSCLAHDDRAQNDDISPPLSHTLLFHEKITANNSAHGGVHPIVSLKSHQANLAKLIDKALHALLELDYATHNGLGRFAKSVHLLGTKDRTSQWKLKPDFISVTRGPGMRSSLTTGLDTAKGLAVAWQIPLVGVNHMQAHALTPRLVSALSDSSPTSVRHSAYKPDFPFLSLLVSGGHTLLVHSQSLTSHPILATTTDIAIGDVIDKTARLILQTHLLRQGEEIMFGRLLENFAFPNGEHDHNYTPPRNRGQEIARRDTKWGWALAPPLAETRSGSRSRAMEFTFSGLGSAVKRICESQPDMSNDERLDLARESLRIAFEHLASRTGWALKDLKDKGQGVETLVVSGGVASNLYLRTV